MAACIRARRVVIRLKPKGKPRSNAKEATVICPARWSRSRLLSYCRREHPCETVVIKYWGDIGWDCWWLVDPAEMLDHGDEDMAHRSVNHRPTVLT